MTKVDRRPSGETGYWKMTPGDQHHPRTSQTSSIRTAEASQPGLPETDGPTTAHTQSITPPSDNRQASTDAVAARSQDKDPIVVTDERVATCLEEMQMDEEEEEQRRRRQQLQLQPTGSDPGGPPSLNFTLEGKRTGIALFVLYTFFDSLLLPVGVYFLLWYVFGPGNPTYHPLSANVTMTIVTTVIGGASIWELLQRAWRLAKAGSRCRVFGAAWWHFDWFEWWFMFSWVLIIVELSVAFVPDDPDKRMMAMPVSTVLFIFGTLSIVLEILRYFSVPAPFKISSIRKGAQLRPGIYPLIEDICAVDGSGGTAFRGSLNRRYTNSAVFRTMLQRLDVFWALGAECCAVMTLALVFGLDDNLDDYAYTIGWALPWVWAGPWILVTIFYVRRELEKEARVWAAEMDSYHRV